MTTLSDYHVVADRPRSLTDDAGIVDLNFNPPNDIVLSGNAVHRPILSWRVDPTSEGTKFIVRLPEGNHTVGSFNLGGGVSRHFTEVIPFSSLNTGNQSIVFDSSSGNAKVSDVVVWFKRNIDTT